MTSEYAEKFDFLTLPEISDYLGIPLSSMYRARDEGEMPPGFTLAGRTRWRRSVIDEWVLTKEAPVADPKKVRDSMEDQHTSEGSIG